MRTKLSDIQSGRVKGSRLQRGREEGGSQVRQLRRVTDGEKSGVWVCVSREAEGVRMSLLCKKEMGGFK